MTIIARSMAACRQAGKLSAQAIAEILHPDPQSQGREQGLRYCLGLGLVQTLKELVASTCPQKQAVSAMGLPWSLMFPPEMR